MSSRRLSGFCGALLGALLPVVFAAAAPPQKTCCNGLHGVNWAPGRQPALYIEWIWTPEIDREAEPRGLAGDCQTTPWGRAALADSPLPAAFDPRHVAPKSLYACILVAPGGSVAAVRLIGGTGRAAVDAALAREIEEEWRFDTSSSEAQWVRVRLDAPPQSQLSVRPPPLALF